MINRVKRSIVVSNGFTLTELMVSLAIGLLLFSGVMSVFVGMRTTTTETSSYGELQENGRFAISVLTDDLLRQNFWGDISGTFSQSSLIATPAAPANDCVGDGVNNATFPQDLGPFITIWGDTIDADEDPLGCFSTPTGSRTMAGSDVLQIKRVLSTPLDAADVVAGNYYLNANLTTGAIFEGGGGIPAIDNSRLWQYQHHVYYVRETEVGSDFVPVLMQGRLTNLTMQFSPVIDGIEMIRFMYGIDTDADDTDSVGYGIVNAYIPAEDMTQALWSNAGTNRVIAVKIFVLARAAVPDFKYTNQNTYLLGDFPYVVDDNYRRLLFSSTVTLYNNSVDSWQ